MEPRRILVVDDHALFRVGLVRTIGQESDLSVCGEATDGLEALQQIPRLKPDLVIVDISLEGMSGLDLTKSIRGRFPEMRLLVLSMHKEALYAERALRAGANGYVMKRENGRTLVAAIRQVLSGQNYLSDELKRRIEDQVPDQKYEGVSPIDRLSDRELEVFQLIGQGYGTRQIADELHVSGKTVETHRENIRAKLNLDSTFELVQRAIQWTYTEKDS